jgi:predicted site-specific integrase-resolvase
MMALPGMNLLTRTEAASFLCISIATIDRLRKKGKITYRKILGRIFFAECDLIEYLNSCAIPARVDGGIK